DAIVFAQRRDVPRLHALQLEAQDVQRLGPFDGRLDAVEHLDPEVGDRVRQERARPAHSNDGTHLLESPDIRARDARVKHVAADADAPALELSESVTQREEIEQPLRGVPSTAFITFDSIRSARNCAAPEAE